MRHVFVQVLPAMKSTNGTSDRAGALESRGYYRDLPDRCPAPGILIRLDQRDGHIRVQVEIDEDADSRGWRQAEAAAFAWRDFVLREQGPWLNGGPNLAIFFLLDQPEKLFEDLEGLLRGRSPGRLRGSLQLARTLRLAFENNLRKALKRAGGVSSAKKAIRLFGDGAVSVQPAKPIPKTSAELKDWMAAAEAIDHAVLPLREAADRIHRVRQFLELLHYSPAKALQLIEKSLNALWNEGESSLPSEREIWRRLKNLRRRKRAREIMALRARRGT